MNTVQLPVGMYCKNRLFALTTLWITLVADKMRRQDYGFKSCKMIRASFISVRLP